MLKSLAERWPQFSIDQQLLMIASEVNRLISGIQKGNFQENRLCIERALELLDLTVSEARPNLQKELLRWRGLLAELYLMKEEVLNQQADYLKKLLKALLQLNGKTAMVRI